MSRPGALDPDSEPDPEFRAQNVHGSPEDMTSEGRVGFHTGPAFGRAERKEERGKRKGTAAGRRLAPRGKRKAERG